MKEGDCFIDKNKNIIIKLTKQNTGLTVLKELGTLWYYNSIPIQKIDPMFIFPISEETIIKEYTECDPKIYDKVQTMYNMFESSMKSILENATNKQDIQSGLY